MSKQKRERVNVRLKDVIIKTGMPHLAEWIYKGKHQKWLSKNELSRLVNGETIRLMVIHPPKHTVNTLRKRREKRAGANK